MKVFVTGATGFIGSAIVKELIGAGHQVVGLARSEASAKSLSAMGATAHQGTIEDLDSLRSGAAAADGVIHTAFFHEITHMGLGTRLRVILGGGPGGIASRYMAAAVGTDRRAIETMGKALAGTDRPLVAAFGTMSMQAGRLATEEDAVDPNSVGGARGETEQAMRALAATGVRTSIVRLPPLVHGEGDRGGLGPRLFQIAQKKRVSAYVGDGRNRWAGVHRLDAAHLFRLALEKGQAGAAYHAVADEGVPFKEIAEVIGRRLNVPLVSKSPSEVAAHFSWFASFVGADNPASSQLTQKRLGWHPTQIALMPDLERPNYFEA